MRYSTYAELEAKVRADLGLEQEEFVKTDEMRGYCNAAINMAEAVIHRMYEDYFLTPTSFALVTDQQEYPMPTDIYANKIRRMIYVKGKEIFPIHRYKRGKEMFEELESDQLYGETTRCYKYYLNNASAAAGVQIALVPTPTETAGAVVKVWYIRNANRMEDDTSLCDIPEFQEYVLEFMKMRCYEKEGNPNAQLSMANLTNFKQSMEATLSEMTPDGENEIEMDMSHYQEMGEY